MYLVSDEYEILHSSFVVGSTSTKVSSVFLHLKLGIVEVTEYKITLYELLLPSKVPRDYPSSTDLPYTTLTAHMRSLDRVVETDVDTETDGGGRGRGRGGKCLTSNRGD